jgi:hypothetical protein
MAIRRDGTGDMGKPRGFELRIRADREHLSFQGLFPVGCVTEAPTVLVPIAWFRESIVGPHHRAFPPDADRRLEIRPEGATTYFWIHGWKVNGWSIRYSTDGALVALEEALEEARQRTLAPR